MMRAGARRAAALVTLVAVIVGLALWVRSGRTPAGGSAPGASATSTTKGDPGLRARAARPPAHASITGRVAEPTGAPVAGAVVCASPGSVPSPDNYGEPMCAESAQDGHYQIKGLSPSRLTLLASAPGYRPMGYVSPDPGRARFLDLREGEARTGVDFTLLRGGVEVKGQIKDAGGGAVAGARVTLNGWMGPTQGAVATRSDERGFFSAWVDEGHFVARATAEGYAEGVEHGAAPGPPVNIVLMPGSVLAGRVVEAGTGAPVAGATIDVGGDVEWGSFRSDVAWSDEEGRFRVTGLRPGRFKPSASVSGRFGQAREAVALGAGEISVEVVIELHPAYDVAGRVEVAPGGGPCPSGFVVLWTVSSTRSADLDRDGVARFEGMLPGSYEVGVICPTYVAKPTYPRVEVKDADVEGLVWTVRAGLSIRGRVVDGDDNPIRAAGVSAMHSGLRTGAFAQSEEDGSFVLTGLGAGSYRVSAEVRNHVSSAPVEVDVQGERVPEVTIVVDGGGTIEGIVVDEDQRPIAGADIRIMEQLRSPPLPPGTSQRPILPPMLPRVSSLADGTFVVKGLRPGGYRVSAAKDGAPLRARGQTDDSARYGIEVTVKAEASARVRIVVERQGGEIAGRVVDADGAPVTDVFVEAVREYEPAGAPGGGRKHRSSTGAWSPNAPALTDAEGEFVVGNLSRGVYTIHAYRKGGGDGAVEHAKVGDTVTVTMQRTGSIAGTVSVPGGTPPKQFTIHVTSTPEMFLQMFLRTESFLVTNGAWTISDVPEGKYEISVDAVEGTAGAEITLASGEQRSGVALVIVRHGVVKGQVVSLDNDAPLVGATVEASTKPRTILVFPKRQISVTDQAGNFEITQVPAEPISMVATPADVMASEYDAAELSVDVQPGAVIDVGRLPIAKRRIKMGEMPGDLGFSLEALSIPGLGFVRGSLDVAFVRPGGPAAGADLRVGDVIVSVDGHDVTGKMQYLYTSLTSVPEGTRVTLGVARGASVVIVASKNAGSPGMPPGAPPPPPAPPPP